MIKNKKFDCVQMKWGIQKELSKEFSGVPDEQKHKIQMERIAHNPILGPFCKKVRSLTPSK